MIFWRVLIFSFNFSQKLLACCEKSLAIVKGLDMLSESDRFAIRVATFIGALLVLLIVAGLIGK